ncbi:MAG: circularly permuted type 2 ATP-grasp protein [Nocardioides sp.]
MTLLRDYAAAVTQPALGSNTIRYDEVVAPDGGLRPAWKPLAEVAVAITEADLGRIEGDIDRFLADDGVTYARPGARQGPWRLDPMPLIIDAAGWAPLEVGLAQRAELLNAVLVDLYGQQRLLREGIVPAPIIFGHAGFARVVARPSVADPRPLVLSATDLGRDAAGEWQVLGDKAQAPSGIGYAMENRRVISRVMPELYREAGLHRMEPYFWALRSALFQSAEVESGDPRVVVLSPGTHSETAYDQAFMASTLGFPLVQGSDLMVRNGWVFLKTPGGLDRVDVILRRVDASFSDSLEMRGDSQLGVVGLVEAVRRGRVRVVNGLGSGVLENPGLMPYLPAACEALLGESLRLPSVATWWGGEHLDHILDHLDSLLIRTLDGPTSGLGALPHDEVASRLRREPHRYVAQELPPLSQAPTWTSNRTTVAKPVSLRTFTLRYGSAYRPLVGGLASVSDEEGSLASTLSKDVWVLKADAGDADQGLVDVLPMTQTRSVTVLVPRALEDLFWAGRYLERTEALLRLVLATHVQAEDFKFRPRTSGGITVGVLLGAITRLAGPGYGDAVAADLDAEFRSVMLDDQRVGSVAHSVGALRDALEGVRDQLSGDTWRAMAGIDRAMTDLRVHQHSHQIAESAGRMLVALLALRGVTSNMIRDAGWHMIQAGASLERALQVARLISATVTVRRGLDVDRDVFTAVVAASESSVTHRRRYRGYTRAGGVLDLLLFDPDNPRSLTFALSDLRVHLESQQASTGSSRPERLLDDLIDMVGACDVATLTTIAGANRPGLEAFCGSAVAQLSRLADAIDDIHFATGPAPRPLLTQMHVGRGQHQAAQQGGPR